MDSIPVTLIVKAPNQQIEDQMIKCELSWTINKLKQHLSEVYPSNPPKHEQKLIYSGQLLSDSVVLKDVLRQYDGQETHTVHLVCTTRQGTPRRQPHKPAPSTPTTTPASTSTVMPDSSSVPGPSPSTSTSEQRLPNATNMQWPNMGQMDPNQYALHMAWVQQAYIQYMTQYMNIAAANASTTATGPTAHAAATSLQQNNEPEQPPNNAPPQPALQRQQPDPDQPERDWLDVFYMISRVMVLFSVVYFYSSPLRFLFVLIFGFMFYLYQIGFFGNLNNNNSNHNNQNVQPGTEQQEIQNPSVLTVVWTFFSTFLASLIPEIPQAV